MADLNLRLLITATNDGALRSVNQLEQSIRGVGASAKQTIADLAHISGAMALWSQVAGSPAAAIAAFARAADEIKGIEARVKLASGSLQEFNQNLAAIRATAQASGTEVASVAALFNRIATPIRDMGGTASDAQQAVASVGQALRISGASAAESSAAMLQFAQAMGSGVLRGEELNSILENAPRLAQAIATGLGVTIGELKRLGEAGALTSAQVLKAVQSQQAALAEEAARLPQTVGMAWTNLGEAAKKYGSEVDKAYGVTQAMAGALNLLASSLPAIASGLGAVAAIAAVAFGANRAAAVAGKLAEIGATKALAAEELRQAEAAHLAAVAVRDGAAANLAAVSTAYAYAGASEAAALADERRAAAARLRAANQGVSATSTGITAAQGVATAASVGLLGRSLAVAGNAGRSLLSLFGGPWGLALTAITAGVFAWEMFGNKAKQAGDEASRTLAKMTAEFNEFSGKRGPQEAAQAFSELKDKAAEAREKLASPLFRASDEGKAMAADLKVADTAIERFEQRVTKFNDQHSKERGLLGLDKLKLDTGGLISDDLQKQLAAFSVLYKDFIANAIGDNNKLKASALEVKAALASLLAAAKTPAEFTGLIGRLGEAIKASPKDATLKSQIENAIESRMQAEMKALNGLVSGLEARARRTQDFFTRAATLAVGQFNQAAALSRAAAELNNDTAGVSRIDTNSRNAEVAVAQQAANLQVAALEQVVDYIGIANELRSALKEYTASNGRGRPTVDAAEAYALLEEKLDILRSLLFGYDYSDFLSSGHKRLAGAANHVLAQKDGKKRFADTALAMSKAFSLCCTLDEAKAVREEVAFFQAVKVILTKRDISQQKRSDEQRELAIRQIINSAVVSGEVVDVFDAVGLDKPNIGILDDDFLAEVRNLPERNLAVELLERLLEGEIRTRFAGNVVQSKKFSELLADVVKRYQNRAIETAQVIEELIAMAKKFRAAASRGEELGLSDDEVRFYDALADNESAVRELTDETLKKIAHELTENLRQNLSVDWSARESVRARLRLMVKRILRKYKYPPDQQEAAVELVLQQAEALGEAWG